MEPFFSGRSYLVKKISSKSQFLEYHVQSDSQEHRTRRLSFCCCVCIIFHISENWNLCHPRRQLFVSLSLFLIGLFSSSHISQRFLPQSATKTLKHVCSPCSMLLGANLLKHERLLRTSTNFMLRNGAFHIIHVADC